MTTYERTGRTALAALPLAGTAATPGTARAGDIAKGDTSDGTVAFSNSCSRAFFNNPLSAVSGIAVKLPGGAGMRR